MSGAFTGGRLPPSWEIRESWRQAPEPELPPILRDLRPQEKKLISPPPRKPPAPTPAPPPPPPPAPVPSSPPRATKGALAAQHHDERVEGIKRYLAGLTPDQRRERMAAAQRARKPADAEALSRRGKLGAAGLSAAPEEVKRARIAKARATRLARGISPEGRQRLIEANRQRLRDLPAEERAEMLERAHEAQRQARLRDPYAAGVEIEALGLGLRRPKSRGGPVKPLDVVARELRALADRLDAVARTENEEEADGTAR